MRKQILGWFGVIQSVLGIPSTMATLASIAIATRARIEGLPWSLVEMSNY